MSLTFALQSGDILSHLASAKWGPQFLTNLSLTSKMKSDLMWMLYVQCFNIIHDLIDISTSKLQRNKHS